MIRSHVINLNSRILLSLFVLLMGTILMYMGFVLSVVINTAARADAEGVAAHLITGIASLEAAYIDLSSRLTPEEAGKLGFIAPTSIEKVTANPSVPTLTLRIDR